LLDKAAKQESLFYLIVGVLVSPDSG